MGRRSFWIGIGAVLGGLFLWWSLRQVSVSEVAAIVRAASPSYLLLIFAASLVFTVVKTLRWRILLQPLAPVKFSDLQGPVFIGTAANLVLSHVGELVRAKLLNRGRHGLASSAVLASIGLERVLDLFAMLLLVAYLFIVGGGRFGAKLASVADVVGVLCALGAFLVMSMVLKSEVWLAAFDRFTTRLPQRRSAWLRGQLVELIGGFKSISQPTLLIKALLASVVQWLVISFALWCSAHSIHLGIDTSAAILVLVFMVFGLTLPTAPGYLGTTQIAFVAALAIYGVEDSGAFAASLLYSAFLVLPQFLIGAVWFLWNMAEQRGHRQAHTLA
ncbi:MAG: lysylphosphatidylglycerol synthase transmembrane domain-containing protein [Steroidobacteraceae bacterium]